MLYVFEEAFILNEDLGWLGESRKSLSKYQGSKAELLHRMLSAPDAPDVLVVFIRLCVK